MSGLRECPFCGGGAVDVVGDDDGGDPIWWTRCQSCKSEGPAMIGIPETRDGAIAAWNARPEPAETRQTVTREEVARVICATEARMCHEQHPCDSCPENCRHSYLHHEAADAVLSLLRKKGIPV